MNSMNILLSKLKSHTRDFRHLQILLLDISHGIPKFEYT